NRHSQMTALLSDLVNNPAAADSLLRERSALLLAPFQGTPAPDSIYGSGSLEDRLARYVAVMDERIDKAASSGGRGSEQAAALKAMRDYVVSQLSPSDDLGEEEAAGSLDAITRLRGGNSGLRGRLHAGVDALFDGYDKATTSLGSLPAQSGAKRQIPTLGDVALAGILTEYRLEPVLLPIVAA
ncbi:MAG: hypothetical protein SGPRY_012049, partial [Prymnesium sp.]